MKRLAAMILALMTTGVVLGGVEELSTQTVKGFRVPEYDDEGKLKSQLSGDFAKYTPNGIIEVTGLKVDMYDKEGAVETTVTAPFCTYDREGGRAGSESEVRIARDNMVVTGEGFFWSAKNERIQIFRKAKVVLKDVRKGMKEGVAEE